MHRSSTSTSTNIKNLAVALEAFSRFPVDYHLNRTVTELLEKEISTMKEEQEPPVNNTPPQTQDDEIPF